MDMMIEREQIDQQTKKVTKWQGKKETNMQSHM